MRNSSFKTFSKSVVLFSLTNFFNCFLFAMDINYNKEIQISEKNFTDESRELPLNEILTGDLRYVLLSYLSPSRNEGDSFIDMSNLSLTCKKFNLSFKRYLNLNASENELAIIKIRKLYKVIENNIAKLFSLERTNNQLMTSILKDVFLINEPVDSLAVNLEKKLWNYFFPTNSSKMNVQSFNKILVTFVSNVLKLQPLYSTQSGPEGGLVFKYPDEITNILLSIYKYKSDLFSDQVVVDVAYRYNKGLLINEVFSINGADNIIPKIDEDLFKLYKSIFSSEKSFIKNVEQYKSRIVKKENLSNFNKFYFNLN